MKRRYGSGIIKLRGDGRWEGQLPALEPLHLRNPDVARVPRLAEMSAR